MVKKSIIFVGYFNEHISSNAIYGRLKQFCPDLRHIEIRSKHIGRNNNVKFCCVSFDNEENANTALKLLSNSVVRKQRLVVRMWQERSRASGRRDVSNRSRYWNGLEKRRKERRGPMRYTHPELEQFFVNATSGKWRPQARIGSILDNDDDANDGFVEAIDPVRDSQVKVCEVSREADRRLISAAPELALQCLSLLNEAESALVSSYNQSNRLAELKMANRKLAQKNRVLMDLYAESLGQRLLLLTSEKDYRRFRSNIKKKFIKEVKKLKRSLGRLHYPTEIVGDRLDNRDDCDENEV